MGKQHPVLMNYLAVTVYQHFQTYDELDQAVLHAHKIADDDLILYLIVDLIQ